jgi:SCP-2 sterol transfer family protein
MQELPGTRLERRMARFVAGLSDASMGRLERGLPRRIILLSMPLAMRLRFKRKLARGAHGVIEFRWLEPDGEISRYMEVRIDDGRCAIRRVQSERPTSTMSVGVADLLRMVLGAVATPTLIDEGRMRLNGDLFMILRMSEIFGMPAEPLV